jgi:putative ABC transport system permease protein
MSIFSDLRITCRTLAKSPAFSLTAVAALAIGIGANTAIFSVVNEVLLNPAGAVNPERIVALRAKYDKLALRSIPVSLPDFDDVHNSSQLIESGAVQQPAIYSYTGATVPEALTGANVSFQWFDVFGAKPRIGRVFQPEEDKPNANQVVVLSYGAWKRLFGQDAGVLGRTMELNQKQYRIVGVMGPEFNWPAKTDVWVPLGLADSLHQPGNRFNESYNAVVRMKPGVRVEQANAWVQVLNERVRNDGTRFGGYAKDSLWGMFLVPFTDFIAGNTKTPMLVLLIAVGFVLLIACSNIAGLMLARASARSREIAVRAALGAGRWNLIKQTLAECLVLSFSGALVGLLLSFAGVRGLVLLAPANGLVTLDVRIDSTVLLFTAIAAIVAGLLFGITPAWQISRMNRFDALKEGGRSGTGGLARQRMRAGLVIGEVALALVLLVGAGLFLRSLASLQDVNPGFQANGVITGFLVLPPTQFNDPAQQIAFFRSALERLSGMPGVTNVAAANPVPFSQQGGSASFGIEGRPTPPGDPGPHGDIAYVSPSYFASLKIPIRSGRIFNDQDQPNTAPVVVIDETLAKTYWPNEDPVGKHMRRGSRAPWSTIVGVVGHTKQADLSADTVKGKYYYCLYQQPIPFMSLLAKTDGDPARLASALREAVHDINPTLAISQMDTLPNMVSQSLAPKRFVVTLLGIFAAMALLMSAIGLYGVISYSVTQRTQELGIRMALGAQGQEVLGLVIGQGMQLAGIGAVIGLGVSLAFSRVLKNQLFQVSAFDPLTFVGTALVLLIAALLACYIPARRATRVDPMDALRYE